MKVYRMLGLNTAHVSKETAQLMHENSIDVACYEKQDESFIYGWYIPIYEPLLDKNSHPNIPKDLRNIIRFALAHGYDYLMFDELEVIIKALPTFNW